ncbi:uncharacterized protein KY384_004404 [Bacidia gigantensis]|uniref:uncharacterized protein n=1 Tax=Bacidia gigantensis TaxID=2732470 RepID=UPI001D0408D0|nr:uncharacterized protein KY384_004404 [Bacidia gigantensis]KAG8531047.1 hypothetical protein KY384_004404 [Bacidia gigantensis]
MFEQLRDGIRKKKIPRKRYEESAPPHGQSPDRDERDIEPDDGIEDPGSRNLLSLQAIKPYRRDPIPEPKNLLPRVQHVSQKTVEKKWAPLDPAAQQSIEQLIQSIQIPVLAKFPTEQNKAEAQELLQSIRREMQQRIGEGTESISRLQHDLEQQKETLETELGECEMLESSIHQQEAALGESRYLSPPDDGARIDDMPTSIKLVQGRLN